MDQDIDNMIAAHIKLMEIIVQCKGDVGHGPGANFAFKSGVGEGVPVYCPYEDRGVAPDRPLVIKMETAV